MNALELSEAPETTVKSKAADRILEQIHRSELFRNYETSFEEATGLSLKLASADGHLIYGCTSNHRNPFCELLDPEGSDDRICAACIRTWRKMALFSELKANTHTCFAGLCESSVPIRIGEQTIGFLFAGEVTTSRLTQAKFEKIITKLRESGIECDEDLLQDAYFSTRVTSKKQYESFLNLLDVFASHLSLICNQLVLHECASEDPGIQRACDFIHDNLADPLELKLVARSASLSSCYFSRRFKEATSLSFTEYIARARVEASKKLLANPKIRISEVAYKVGFQSLTHFNRVFKGISGVCPTQFRKNFTDAALYPHGDHTPHGECSPLSGQR